MERREKMYLGGLEEIEKFWVNGLVEYSMLCNQYRLQYNYSLLAIQFNNSSPPDPKWVIL